MTDLELTRRCAVAMGFENIHATQRNGVWIVIDDRKPRIKYDPLHDDAQAMALVKKFNIGWDKEEGHEWHVALRNGSEMCFAHDMNLNRAICLCVAQMGEAK